MGKLVFSLFWMLFLSLSSQAASNDLKSAQTKLKKLGEEMRDLQSSLQLVQNLKSETQSDLKQKEERFQDQFAKLVAPLLHWPELSIGTHIKSWIQQEQGRFLLERLRARLVEEPLTLIADRELNMRQISGVEDELRQRQDALQRKKENLELQSEELKMLQRKQSSRR